VEVAKVEKVCFLKKFILVKRCFEIIANNLVEIMEAQYHIREEGDAYNDGEKKKSS